MILQKRPPKTLNLAIMKDVLARDSVTSKDVERSIRHHVSGTPFGFPQNVDLIAAYRALTNNKSRRQDLERLLRVKNVRTDSGVAPITVLTKPFPCPGKCVYCPSEARMPKSYLASEPAAARALHFKFDPYDQVFKRVQMLETNGHEAKKIELIVKGGTWSAYPWSYRQWFIKRCFDAANHLGRKRFARYSTLSASQKANESAIYRIIGLTIETRPDWVNAKEIDRLRQLGVTRIELGVQVIDDKILKLIKRGHTVDHVADATALLKSAAFKVDYHFMPGLPGSSPAKDVAMFKKLFSDPRFCPDMVKIYPCAVLPSAELAAWFKQGKFKPLEGKRLVETIIKMKACVPYYCRISRVIRDFPSFEVTGGNKATNLRDMIKLEMKERGLVCKCLRCREAGHRPTLDPKTELKLFVEKYPNANGEELLLSYEDSKRTTVMSFLRMRLPARTAPFLLTKGERKGVLESVPSTALIRELHTYGQAIKINEFDNKTAVQHKGLGKRLMEEAERIAKKRGYRWMSVISGIGVRAYYRWLGYRLKGTYMVKRLA